MNNKGMRKGSLWSTTTILLILIVLLALPFSAAEEVVEVRNGPQAVSLFYATSGDSTYDVCAYGLYTDSVTIRNQGSIFDTYYLTLVDDGSGIADSITFSESVVTLEAGEEKTIYLYTKTGADMVGTFSYNIVFTSTYDDGAIIEKTVHVSECPNLGLSTLYTGQETCPCSTGVYVFTLVNSGALSEDYTLWLEGVDQESYELSEYYVTLGAGERMTIYGYVRLPCYMYGSFDLSLRTVSENTQYEALLPLSLDVEQACYAFNVGMGEALVFSAEETLAVTYTAASTLDYTLCEEDPAIIPIYMQNPSDILNEYRVYVQDATAWISAAEPHIRLSSMQEHVSSLILNTAAAEPGVYSFALKVETTRGDLESVTPFTVEVLDCDGIATKNKWLEVLLWVLLGLLVVGIIALATVMALRHSEEGNTKKSKKGAKKTTGKQTNPFVGWCRANKWWLIPLLALLLLLLLVGAFGLPVVKQAYEDRLAAGDAADLEEAKTVPTLLYEWMTALLLLLLLLLLAFLVWWYKLCDKAKRKRIKDNLKKKWQKFKSSVGPWFRKVWNKIKPWMKWLWIVLLLLLLLSGFVAGMYFLYNNYKEDAGKFFAVDDEEEVVVDVEEDTSDEDAEALATLQEKLLDLQEQIREKEKAIRELEELLLEKIEQAFLVKDLSSEELDALQDEIAALQETIDALDEELAALLQERSDLLESIDDLETKIGALEDQIIGLEDQLEALDEQIAALQDLVAQLTLEKVEDEIIEDIEDEISDLEEEVRDIEEEKDLLEEVVEDVTEDIISTVDEDEIPEIVDKNFKTVLAFDVSLSGQIVEDGMSRFDRGIQEAQKYIQEKGVYTIMVVGKNALVIRRDTQADIAVRVLKTLRPLDTQSNLGKALYAARDDIGTEGGRIVLVSDMITTDGTNIDAIREEIEDMGIEVVFLNVAFESTSAVDVEVDEVVDDSEVVEETVDTEEVADEEIEGDEVEQSETEEPLDTEEVEDTTETDEGPVFDVASQTKGSFFIEIPMNTHYNIALNSYFADPDGDELMYRVDVGDHLTAVLEGSVVTLIPETDWLGDSSVIFSADDGKGGAVVSPEIRVSIVEEVAEDYVPYIIIGSIIALIIVSLVFGAFSKKFEDPGIPPDME